MPKFKYGDYAVANGYKAKVISVSVAINGGYTCKVRFSDGQEKEYPENHLKPYISYTGGRRSAGSMRDNDVNCPLCGEKWHIIPSPFLGHRELWYDCKRCNKTRKAIKKELEEIKNDDFGFFD